MVAAKEAGMHSVELLMMLGSIGTALSIPIKMGYFIFFGKDKNIQPKPVPKNMYVAAVIGAALCILFGVCPNLAYRMLPYAMDYHPYTFHHILEYMQLVPAALLAFLMYIRKMEPHSLLTLDIDWFARVPFKKFIVLLTRIFSGIQLKMESIGRKIRQRSKLRRQSAAYSFCSEKRCRRKNAAPVPLQRGYLPDADRIWHRRSAGGRSDRGCLYCVYTLEFIPRPAADGINRYEKTSYTSKTLF